MKITFLGTSSMVPTKQRSQPAVLLTYKDENILIDCGEGTQRQLKFASLKPTKITKVLITHWHGDHVLGLPGLIQTMASSNYSKTLQIYGPKNTKKFLQMMAKTYILENKIKLDIIEIQKEKFLETKDFILTAKLLKHTAPCLAFSFIEKDKRKINLAYTKKFGLTKHPLLGKLQQGKDITFKGHLIKANKATNLVKGRKITFIYDTLMNKNCISIAQNSTILICEATFSHELKEKAFAYQHLTTKQAAEIAKKSHTKKLILTHFSQRYKKTFLLVEEAKTIFKNTTAAKDLEVVEV